MKITVTGHMGFVGTNLLNHLEDAKEEIGCHTIDGADRRGATSIDLADPRAGIRVVGRMQDSDAVVHLAAMADVRNNWAPGEIERMRRDNIVATLNALAWAAEAGVRRFVFVSTGAVYASHDGPVTEETYCRATSPYAASKLAGEAMVQAYAEKFGWDYYIFRPAACFGRHYHHGHIRDFVHQANTVGTITALDSGTLARAVLHVGDLADAIVGAVTLRPPSGLYNLASDDKWSWRDTIRIMGDMSGEQVPFTCPKSASGWVGDGYGATIDASKARSVGMYCNRTIDHGVRESLKSLGWPQ